MERHGKVNILEDICCLHQKVKEKKKRNQRVSLPITDRAAAPGGGRAKSEMRGGISGKRIHVLISRCKQKKKEKKN